MEIYLSFIAFPLDNLYAEMTAGQRRVGRLELRSCRRDLKFTVTDPDEWEQLACNHSKWRSAVQGGDEVSKPSDC